MIMRSLKRSQSGATAIEYAIIAGIIGLGLVGSLVATRGSLSGIFGTAGSSMASGVAGDASASSPRAPFWGAKTLTGAPAVVTSGTNKQTVYTYTDGTQVGVLRDTSVTPARLTVIVTSADRKSFQSAIFSETGQQLGRLDAMFYGPVSFNTTQYVPGNFPAPDNYPGIALSGANLQQSSYTNTANFVNGVPNYVVRDNFNASGGYTGRSPTTPDQQYLDNNTILGYDWSYFKDLTK